MCVQKYHQYLIFLIWLWHSKCKILEVFCNVAFFIYLCFKKDLLNLLHQLLPHVVTHISWNIKHTYPPQNVHFPIEHGTHDIIGTWYCIWYPNCECILHFHTLCVIVFEWKDALVMSLELRLWHAYFFLIWKFENCKEICIGGIQKQHPLFLGWNIVNNDHECNMGAIMKSWGITIHIT
jgi:hypothetical protein